MSELKNPKEKKEKKNKEEANRKERGRTRKREGLNPSLATFYALPTLFLKSPTISYYGFVKTGRRQSYSGKIDTSVFSALCKSFGPLQACAA